MNNRVFPKLGGYVTDSKDKIYNKENPYGLFSQQIFGPKINYKCECGKLNGVINNRLLCSKCGVLCGTNDLRYTQYGKIETMLPYIKPTKLTKIIKYLGPLSKNLINPNRSEYNVNGKKYLALKFNSDVIKIVGSLTPISKHLIIPFRITGIYSLYLSLKFIADYLNNQKAKEICDLFITNSLKVIPPNLRTYTFDYDKKQTRSPPINKLYTSVLNLNKINIPLSEKLKQDELDWLEKIKIHLKDRIFDQDIVDSTLFYYDSQSAGYQRIINNVYESILKVLSGKSGLIRNLILSRIIEFSGRAVITVDPSLPPHQIKVGKKILKTLWMPYFLYYLINHKDVDVDIDSTKYFEKYLLNEVDNVEEIDELFDEFLIWFYEDPNI